MTTADVMPVLPTVDKRASAQPARTLADLAEAGRKHLADNGERLPALPPIRPVLTLHERYGQPPGDLAYTAVENWTPEQHQRGAKWLASQQAAEWWAAQGAAQRMVP